MSADIDKWHMGVGLPDLANKGKYHHKENTGHQVHLNFRQNFFFSLSTDISNMLCCLSEVQI